MPPGRFRATFWKCASLALLFFWVGVAATITHYWHPRADAVALERRLTALLGKAV